MAKAYEIKIVDEKAGLEPIVYQLIPHEQAGTFNRQPKHPYYGEKAKFTSDQIKEAMHGGGYTKNGVPVPILFPWTGPDPDPKPVKVEPVQPVRPPSKYAPKSELPIKPFRKRAKELGINSFQMGVVALQAAIAEAEAKIAKAAQPPIDQS